MFDAIKRKWKKFSLVHEECHWPWDWMFLSIFFSFSTTLHFLNFNYFISREMQRKVFFESSKVNQRELVYSVIAQMRIENFAIFGKFSAFMFLLSSLIWWFFYGAFCWVILWIIGKCVFQQRTKKSCKEFLWLHMKSRL